MSLSSPPHFAFLYDIRYHIGISHHYRPYDFILVPLILIFISFSHFCLHSCFDSFGICYLISGQEATKQPYAQLIVGLHNQSEYYQNIVQPHFKELSSSTLAF